MPVPKIVESIDMEITSLEQGGLVLLEICCIEANLVKVENETNKILKSTLTEVPTEQEVKRAHQLIKSAICFGLEAPSQVAAIAGNQLLWGRNEGLLDPLKDIPKWTGYMLQKRIFPKLQPENSFTLIAKPLKEIK